MKIERINSYADERFRPEILRQHGAFLIDGQHPCEFEIIGGDSAVVQYHDQAGLDEIIDEFRFYTEHITKFYDKERRLIKAFSPMEIFWVGLEEIQPSQFFVDEEKVRAVQSFIHEPEDIVIPLLRQGDKYISLDGHTRLFVAREKGFERVRGFLTEAGKYIFDFVAEAQSRGIYSIHDAAKLPHAEYEVRWNQFCDRYFGR